MRSPILLSALFVLSCHRQTAPKPAEVAHVSSPPAATAPSENPGGMTVSGKVLERIDANPYSYLRLDTLSGEQWAAVPQCELKNGDQAVVSHAISMDGFESKTLKRKFDRIVFGILDTGQPAPANQPSPHAAAGNPHAAGDNPHAAGENPHAAAKTPPADIGPISVPRASGAGAVTVSEAFAQKASLSGKSVRVRAKVVKVLAGIMGKNWLHVRDGSGSDDKKDNDLTVTTDDVATVGSTVLVQGVLHTDKDLGSGYNFPVIVENAKVTKE
jgi:hypothetical protein